MSVEHTDRPGLLQYLDRRIPGGHSGNWPEFQFFCAWCLQRKGSESSGRKFRFNAAKGQGKCFRCGYGCRTLEGLFKSLNGGNLTAEESDLIAGDVRSVTPDRIRDELLIRFYSTDRVKPPRPVYLPSEYTPLAGNGNKLTCRPAFGYLRGVRGFTAGLAAFLVKHAVGYCLTGDYAHRLVFPVRQGGRVVYFTSRFCGDHFQKAKNPKNEEGRFTRDLCLLNYDGCVGAKTVYVVEGPMSMAPFDHPCALMGKVLADGQLKLLETLADQGTEEFVLGTDPDASREASETFRRMKGSLPCVTYLRLDGGDPFDLRAEMQPFIDTRRDRIGLSDALRNLRARIPRASIVRT